MNPLNHTKCLGAVLLSGVLSLSALGQDNPPKKDTKPAAGQPSESDMMAMMMDLAKPGENHKLLSGAVGAWSYTVKMWMNPDPSAPPSESTGSATFRSAMGGRYIISDHTGKMEMPGPDGKPMQMEFKGMGIDGYDNVKKKFVSSWIDNMGTSIMLMEGTYDAGSKTFTYRAEQEMMPGMKTKIRMALKLTDHDHHTFEWYEDRGGTEVKTMEIKYTRKS